MVHLRAKALGAYRVRAPAPTGRRTDVSVAHALRHAWHDPRVRLTLVLLIAALPVVCVVGGCRILGFAAVPCTTAEHCAPSDECIEGLCVPVVVGGDDGGLLVDGGGTDAGEADAGGKGPPETCRDVLTLDEDAPTGEHEIFPPGRPEGVVVWCDMRFAGGGWLLAARSVDGPSGGLWGWGAERGTPGATNFAYSAGVTAFGITATELLVTENDSDGDPDRSIYRLVFESDVLAARTTTVARVDIEILETRCAGEIDVGQGQPWMLQHAGCTDRTDVYMLRDNPSCDNYGLRPDGFSLNYDTCHQGAGLQDRARGAIYVR